MSASISYDYQGFSGGPTYKQVGKIGETVRLANASGCTKPATTSSTSNYITFNTNGGQGNFSNISKTYSRSTTYTPNG